MGAETTRMSWLEDVATTALVNEAGAWAASSDLHAAVEHALSEPDATRARALLTEALAAYNEALRQQLGTVKRPPPPP